jgi:dimethylamine/trimethylamine dehydrogenase
MANVLTPDQVIKGEKAVPPGKLVIYDTDGYYMAASLAEQFVREGRDVTIITPHPDAAHYMKFTTELMRMNRHLRKLGVKINLSSVLVKVEPGHVVLHEVWGTGPTETMDFDALVLVTQRNSDNALYRELIGRKDEWETHGIMRVFRIGDCVAPGIIADAVFDGHRLAREIDSANPEIPLPFIRERPVVSPDGKLRHPLQA